ncbi:helix-turn-helix domain-containing protein [Actinomadura sp. LD22]|uniref:Helix-turn-helix domain-containing protein n=1 Tax=Actinomadura physcomitrii TaxID=2650748 RepID=A0A6I4M2G6_9ACTN|nr:helix-turn-helix transcriptional regulator [Actinomadura physcomitrii]MVZ99571.1 helix-turn-helix domain-containing protein [Actinomadura physcomitrii]
MENAQRPTMRSRKLGQRLRAIREERGLTLQKAARLLNRTPSSLSKLETGKRGIRRPALEHMLDRYEISDLDERQALYDLASHAAEKGWWRRYEGRLAPSALDYIALEAEAISLKSQELHLVPGLMQIEEYAREVIASASALGGEPDIDGLVEVRMRRQQVLFQPQPPHLSVVVHEAVIRQQFGGRQVTQAQLRRIIELAELPNVSFQVLPFAAGTHPGLNGSFTTLTTNDLSVVLVESLTTGWYLEDPFEIGQYEMVFDQQMAKALPPSDSRALIEQLLSES